MFNRTTVAIVMLALVTPTAALAAPDPVAALEHRLEPDKPHVVHVEWTTLAFVNGLTVNYEHQLSDNFALRVGYGASAMLIPTAAKAAHGPLIMATLLLGGSSNFELSGGVSVIEASSAPPSGAALGDDWYVSPNVFAGYRYQDEVGGGLVVRAGFGINTGFGTMFTLGAGYAF